MMDYIALGYDWHNNLTFYTAETPAKALYGFAEKWNHDPKYIFTQHELTEGETRIKRAIVELREKGMI